MASRYVLDQPAVAAVIVGARDGRHLSDTLRIGSLKLTDEDAAGIGAVLAHRIPLQGDVYALERDRKGRHGSIMKYNPND